MSRVGQLLKIAHGDVSEVVTVSPTTPVVEVARLISTKKMGAFPVMDGDKLVGIISERDLATRVMAGNLNPQRTLVREVMTRDPQTVTPYTDMMDCMNLMKEIGARHIPVIDKGKLVGIVSLRDILYSMWKNQELLAMQFEAYITGSR